MRWIVSLIACSVLALAPSASAHGALTLNEFDTYAISDFEGHEDSFPWEGFEIWDVYAGDGYSQAYQSHGVYFKANLAGDGTERPTGSDSWDIDFSFKVGGESYQRTVSHDGVGVRSDFEQFEWQIADGNVLQLHAWTPVPAWEGQSISELVVVSSVDGAPRDSAPGGFHDPVTGQEIPFNAPAVAIYPEMGEGRIVETVPLTGAAKFLDVAFEAEADGSYEFTVTNPLAAQGQHFMFHMADTPAWTVTGAPAAESLDAGASTTFVLSAQPNMDAETIEPLRVDLLTDIGGLQSFYLFVGEQGLDMASDPASALSSTGNPSMEAPGVPLLWVMLAGLVLAARKRSG